VRGPDIRQTYLETCAASLALLRHEAVAEKWRAASVLPDFTVSGLAGHLSRSTLQVEMFLDAPEPHDEPITAVEYYARLVGAHDPSSELNVGVRARGEQVAALGHAGVVDTVASTLGRLRDRLPLEPPERLLSAFDRTLRLDEYLRVRLIELTVHIDDLACSVGANAPAPPSEAYDIAIEVLVSVGRTKHGDVAVLRALTRRERDTVDALRVL
jgi:hypothetical protein